MNALPIRDSSDPGSVGSLGFYALYAYMFIIFSASLDLVPGIRSVRPSLLIAIVGLLVVGISGRAIELLQHKLSRLLLALTGWLVLCIPFSIWPGGTAHTLIEQWNVALLSFFLPAGLLYNHRQCRKIAHVIAVSGFILALLALKINALSTDGGRLRLPNTRYANSNDLAMMMLMALPFVIAMGMRFGGLRRLLALAAVPAMLLVVARSGSRTALIALAASMAIVFFRVSMAQKAALVAAAVSGFMVMALVLPDSLAKRFVTIFGSDDEVVDSVAESSIASAYSRKTVLLDSLVVTMRNPIFGVGAGNFPVAQNEIAVARGEAKGLWRLTHNTYTQLSSEAGLPGFFIYLIAIVVCWRSLSGTIRLGKGQRGEAWQDVVSIASTMHVSLAAMLVCFFFSSEAYNLFFTVMAGFAVGIEYCARRLAMQSRPPAVQTMPPQGRNRFRQPVRGMLPMPQKV
jgi:O-antigen ligase